MKTLPSTGGRVCVYCRIAIRAQRVCVQGVRVRPDTVDKEKNMTEPQPREALFSALGVTISPYLPIQALTHRSFSHEHPGTSNY